MGEGSGGGKRVGEGAGERRRVVMERAADIS